MMTSRKLWVGASAIVLLTVSATLVDVSGFIRGAAALLFVLLLPGWAITAALLPEKVFGFWERLAIAVGLSIAIAMLTGLLLHLTPWGIQTGVWWSLMAGITLIAGLVALGRTPVPFNSSRSSTQQGTAGPGWPDWDGFTGQQPGCNHRPPAVASTRL
jgi:uncharacterized membrane protein